MGNPIKAIPLCQLQRTKTNVRKTDRTADIEQLAASIEAHGLLENLVVSSVGTREEPLFHVIAGGRRHAALKLLAKRKKIEPDHPVPCLLRKPNGVSLTELSLAENFERAPLHPADQFEAFAKLNEDGQSAEEIAARFGLTTALVLQRLKLASVPPRLIAVYRKGEMTLEQLMAFAISDDHKAQEEYWFDLPYADRSPFGIRRFLTKTHVDGYDRRARFIGAKAYEAAGGIIVRDLFDTGDEGRFTDSQLLDRLAGERLTAIADEVRGEGWKWAEIATDAEAARISGLSHARMVEVPLSKKDEKRLARLARRYDELVDELEENDGASSEEFDRVAEELSALQAKKEVWPDEEKSRAGVMVSLDRNGSVSIVRGLIRGEDQQDAPREEERADGQSNRPHAPYSESLMLDLSAHRTAALREVLAGKPEQALTALLVTLAQAIVLDGVPQGCIGIGVHCVDLDRASKSVGESKAAQGFSARHDKWLELLSATPDLWASIEKLDASERFSLLAHCVAASVNGLWARGDADGRLAAADLLANRIGLDMADWWRPTSDVFLMFIKKEQIVDVVTEARSTTEAKRLVGLKKRDMAERAEGLLSETRWLPEPLRSPVSEG